MEMRAQAETGMSQDLTPQIPPLAASLHDSSLPSHCSSCFLPLPYPPDRIPHPGEASPLSCCCGGGGGATLRYCSTRCRDADLDVHASSGECQLLRLLRLHRPELSTLQRDDTTDLRAALRLIRSFEKLGFHLPPWNRSGRIGGLLAGKGERVEEGRELWGRVREGGLLMSRARKLLRDESCGGEDGKDGCGGGDGGGEAEEAALWAVDTNAVEVQVGDGRAVGIAVYGPGFSWFNHSCSPNACYRFELPGFGFFRSSEARFLVYPTGGRSKDDMMAWELDERQLHQGLDRYGPRIVVRSIRPIRQGEEVCITYTDLLQPKALRRADLWSKYGFICCCKRCSACPEMYVDHILSETTFSLDTVNLNSDDRHQNDGEMEEPADMLDQAVTEYLSTGNHEACCLNIENMLSNGFRGEQLQLVDSSQTRFRLHPLHHVSLKAYITLTSIYRIRACDLETFNGRDYIAEAFRMRRVAAAYSLLLAGATHHLFLSELSLIVATALFWINVGESFLILVRGLVRGMQTRWVNLLEFNKIFIDAQGIITCRNESLSWLEFKLISSGFLDCVSRISPKVWLFVVSGIQCLSDVYSPVDFSLLGKKNFSHQILGSEIVAARTCHPGNEEGKCIGCNCEAEMHIEEDSRNLYKLAIHCLVYGGYLATISYGYKSYWVDHIRKLLSGEREK